MAFRLMQRTCIPLLRRHTTFRCFLAQSTIKLMPDSLIAPNIRYLSTAPKDDKLLKLLRTEIDDVLDSSDDEKDEELRPPQPFSLVDKPGTNEIVLQRSFDAENIHITCVQKDGYYGQPFEPLNEEEQEDEKQLPTQILVSLTVNVSKGEDSSLLKIQCTCTNEFVSISRITYQKASSSDATDASYQGPELVELDEDIQKQFHKFLETRGIDRKLGKFLMNYMSKKEKREYLKWLESIESFIKKE